MTLAADHHPMRRETKITSPASVVSGIFLVLSFLLILLQDSVDLLPSKASRLRTNVRVIPNDEDVLESGDFSIDGVITFLNGFIRELHDRLSKHHEGSSSYHDIWEEYHSLVVEQLLPWDQEYLQNMPERRLDDSIFLSIASYRDENCMNTLQYAYERSKKPERLNVGLVQQNCNGNCIGGVQKDGTTLEHVPPDLDCYSLFCSSKIGKSHCRSGRVRVLRLEETESMGPYCARFFASKLWNGETWFIQLDSHMTFAQDWDEQSIAMLRKAPSSQGMNESSTSSDNKPILSNYPTDADADFDEIRETVAGPICDGLFSEEEGGIIRLESTDVDYPFTETPRFGAFVAAGYFVAHSGILQEVPFDPFLPWIFMGEEIIMSARFWTHGYDIFSPTHDVVGHIYVRRGKPKFWETLGRLFWDGIHNPLQFLVLRRVKHLIGYPEDAVDLVKPKSLLTSVDLYGMGEKRSLNDYLKVAGFNPVTKQHWNDNEWCQNGKAPPGYEGYNRFYTD